MARGTEEFMRTYLDYRGDAHMLPAPGTMRDQSCWWVKAVRIADAERSKIEHEQQQMERRRMQAQMNKGRRR